MPQQDGWPRNPLALPALLSHEAFCGMNAALRGAVRECAWREAGSTPALAVPAALAYNSRHG